MSDLDNVISEAVASQDVPFLVGMLGDAKGVIWSGAAGERSPGQPATVDTVFRIFSMTKAVGSTAAMILIDRGKLSADTVVETILPEFSELKVLEGFDEKRPRLRAPRTKATVRHLATHTSGLVYEFWNTGTSLHGATGHPTILSGLAVALKYPLSSIRAGAGTTASASTGSAASSRGSKALDRSLLQGGDLIPSRWATRASRSRIT
jgi:CubicO group peptidase (beta-lactamase class C family)